jgi:flagellar motor switch protein FliM
VGVRKRLGASVRANELTVEPYDFYRPAALSRDQSRMLELVYETFARQWGTQLTAKVRVVSRVTFETASLLTYDDYIARLPETSAMVLLAIDDVAGRGILQFPTSAAFAWVGRMLGGTGRGDHRERPFTQIEQALVRRLAEDALEDLRYSMGPLMPLGVSVEAFHYNPQFAQAAATTDLMIVAAFDIEVGDRSTSATLAIPAEALLPQVGNFEPQQGAAEGQANLRAHLAGTPVEVAVAFDPTPVNPRAVLGLAEGDVLRLVHPQHRPLTLTVAGQPVARAAVGANGSRLACVIVDSQEAS